MVNILFILSFLNAETVMQKSLIDEWGTRMSNMKICVSNSF